jgi:hypothetical protein
VSAPSHAMVMAGAGRPRTVVLHPDRVVKRQRPDLMRVEVEKMRRARAIGEATGAFYVPDVLDFDERTGEAVFERVGSLVSLGAVVARRGAGAVGLVRSAAGALAQVHAKLRLPPEMAVPLPGAWALEADECFLHGDYNTANVAVAGGDRIVLLDWATSDVAGERATVGTCYFDVAFFATHLFRQLTFAPRATRHAPGLAAEFLRHYLAQRPGRVSAEALLRYLPQHDAAKNEVFRELLPGWKYRLMQVSRVRFRRFVAGLEL